MTEQAYFLGIDWGKSKTGLALADGENRIAVPLKEVDTDDLIDEIKKILVDNLIDKIVFGLNESSAKARAIDEMKSEGWDVIFENEDFSTLMAQKNIKEFREKNITKQDNAEAARIILQSWLDRNEKK